MVNASLLIGTALVLAALNSVAAPFTWVTLSNTSPSAKSGPAITFGMVFKAKDVPKGQSVLASMDGADIPIQVDAKARHADGSLRHAVLTLWVDSLAKGGSKTVQLSSGAAAAGAGLSAADLLKTAFDAVVSLDLAGAAYTASAKSLLASGEPVKWLDGPLCTEWLVSAPLKSADGKAHPQLSARFAIRAYKGMKAARADMTVENTWTFEPGPQGLTYDAALSVAGTEVYSKKSLAHTHHARWRKTFWWGGDPSIHWQYDLGYLLSTDALPIYDQGIKVAPAALAGMRQSAEPMANLDLSERMPNTGAQEGIGPLPRFAALYLLTMDPRALNNLLLNGNCGGSYQIHYRHKPTDLPVTIDEFPYMTLLGNPSDAQNPKTGKSEAFPNVTNPLETLTPDDAHQPSVGFLPYLVSGDYYHLEELQFWADWNLIQYNPAYRGMEKGLLNRAQIRGQAWSMRTLGHAAYITPDDHPLKNYFVEKLGNNIDWYTATYVGSDAVNKLGWLEGQYPYGAFGIAPWQDDFFTWTMGYLNQLGFEKVVPFLKWKSQYVIGRMTNADYCWLRAPGYSVQIGTADKIAYKTFKELFQANYSGTACTGTVMDGYPEEPDGYVANMQPGLAAAVDAGLAGGAEAWSKYQTRSPKQNYVSSPQFAVVPKSSLPNSVIRSGSGRAKSYPAATRLLLYGRRAAFDLAYPASVVVEIFDTSGRRISRTAMGKLEKGRHAVAWNNGGIPGTNPKPVLVRIETIDAFHHREYLGVDETAP